MKRFGRLGNLARRLRGDRFVAVDGRVVATKRPPKLSFAFQTWFIPCGPRAEPPERFDPHADGVVLAGLGQEFVPATDGWDDQVGVSAHYRDIELLPFQDPGHIFSATLPRGHWQVVVVSTPYRPGPNQDPRRSALDPEGRTVHWPRPRALDLTDVEGRFTVSLRVTLSDRVSSAPPAPAPERPSPAHGGAAVERERGARVGVLEVFDGPEAGRRFDVCIGDTQIGRARDAVVRLSHATVSLRHALIRATSDRIVIASMPTSSGAYVGGKRISKCALKGGETIVIGQVRLRFERDRG